MRKSMMAMACVLSLFFVSCQKELSEELGNTPGAVPGTPTTPGVTGDFRVKVNGVQFVANQVASAVRANGLINLTGTNTDGKIVTITLTDSGVHVYQLRETTINAGAYSESANGSTIAFASNGSDDPNRAGGTVTVTSIDTVAKKISGTFNFKVFRQSDSTGKSLTEGVFTNLSYATQAVTPGNATDTFRVKIDGADWVNYSGSAVLASIPGFSKINIISNYDASARKNIGISVDPAITPGSYTFELFGDVIGIYNNGATPNVSYTGEGGNLTIVEHNTTTKRIRGTFNFPANVFGGTGTPIQFTQGYFSMRYQ